MEFLDLSTLITLGIAVFVLLRLRSVLGQKTGHFDDKPMTRRRPPERRDNEDDEVDVSNDNVVTLPNRKTDAQTTNPALAEIDSMAKPRTKLNKGLRSILERDPTFSPKQFLSGAEMAYEMIVSAFADGDKKTLKNLLSKEVYDGFASAISDRESRGETVRHSFVGIDNADIQEAVVANGDAQIMVKFVSQIVSATYNKDDEIIDGDADQVAEVVDLWTFARDVKSRDPNWRLVATEAGS